MIESLTMENFQRHAYLKIDFDKITTIIGTSDIGKSAIIRAIRWIMTNRPLGSSFIRRGTDSVTVTMMVDGTQIERIRKGTYNAYALCNPGADKKRTVFKSFGNGVPPAVLDLLNMSDLNIQGQHDPSLWFSLSAGQVAQQLNSVIDLDTIDKSRTALVAKYNALKQDAKKIEEELHSAKNRLAELEYVNEVAEELIILEMAENKREEIKNIISNLVPLIEEGEKLAKRIIDIPDTSELDNLVAQLDAMEIQISRLNPRVKACCQLLSNIRDIPDTFELDEAAEELRRTKIYLDSLKPLVDEGARLKARIREAPDISQLDAIYTELTKLSAEISKLRNISKDIINAVARQVAAENRYQEAEREFRRIMGDVCPLCGSKLS